MLKCGSKSRLQTLVDEEQNIATLDKEKYCYIVARHKRKAQN